MTGVGGHRMAGFAVGLTFSSRQVAQPQSQLLSDSRPPSRDELRFPAQSAAATIPAAPAQSPAVASFRSRHCPCQPRLPAPQSKLLSWAFNMAGFEVTLHGRFWVTPEGTRPIVEHSLQSGFAYDQDLDSYYSTGFRGIEERFRAVKDLDDLTDRFNSK